MPLSSVNTNSPTPRIFNLDETDSTNLAMWRMLEASPGLDEWTIVQAAFQQAGRGQAGSQWHSDKNDSLLYSVLLRPVFLKPGKQFILNKAIAIAICETLRSLWHEAQIVIKWPNDIYAGKHKIAGTLIENRILGNTFELCVAGIGVNLNQLRFPEHIPNPTSLKLISGQHHQPEKCANELTENIRGLYELLQMDETKAIDNMYLDRLLGYGQTRAFEVNGEMLEAAITGVNEFGKLLLTDQQGRRTSYGMKEIRFLF